MRDFAVSTASMPLDQADGLRRLFADAPVLRIVPVLANPHVAFSGVAIERLTQALAVAGRHTLVVDAADTSPPPQEWARLDLSGAVERLGPQVSYLAARGLPRAHVDTRGSSAGFLERVVAAVPDADVVLVHGEAADLARLFGR
ncbi:MAG: flagellar biosynthesis protein, partial [Rubrivivax sp.]